MVNIRVADTASLSVVPPALYDEWRAFFPGMASGATIMTSLTRLLASMPPCFPAFPSKIVSLSYQTGSYRIRKIEYLSY